MGAKRRIMQGTKRFEPLACLLAGFAASGLTACASGPSGAKFEVEPGAEVNVEGLHKVINSDYRYAWVKPGADFASYTAIVLDPVEISYRREPMRSRYDTSSGNFALTDTQMAKMKHTLREAFSAEFDKSPYYAVTDTWNRRRFAPAFIVFWP